jgi:hypothetical protein
MREGFVEATKSGLGAGEAAVGIGLSGPIGQAVGGLKGGFEPPRVW